MVMHLSFKLEASLEEALLLFFLFEPELLLLLLDDHLLVLLFSIVDVGIDTAENDAAEFVALVPSPNWRHLQHICMVIRILSRNLTG